MALVGMRKIGFQARSVLSDQILRPYTWIRCQSEKQLSTTSPQNKVYELRTYSIHPQYFPAYVQITNEKIHLRTAYSKLNGFFVSELGGCNQSFHVWEYDSLEHRANLRTELGKDQSWINEYVKVAFPYIQKQDNVVVTSLPDIDVEAVPDKSGGVYELHEISIKPRPSDVWLKDVTAYTRACAEVFKQLQQGQLMGAWCSQIGPGNTVYQLWNYTSIAHVMSMREEINKDHNVKSKEISYLLKDSVVTKVLNPLPFSPWK